MAAPTEEQRKELFTKLGEIYDTIRTRRQELTSIVLEEVDAATRLRKLKRCILQHRIQAQEQSISTTMTDISTSISELSLAHLQLMADFMKKCSAPVKEYIDLEDNIGGVIRDSELTDDQKIDRITDLLI